MSDHPTRYRVGDGILREVRYKDVSSPEYAAAHADPAGAWAAEAATASRLLSEALDNAHAAHHRLLKASHELAHALAQNKENDQP